MFKISPSRSADVLIDVLGQEFEGVLGCDYFSAYRRYMREFGTVVQFCLAHFIRDVKYLTTLPEREDRAYGERLREALRQLFGVIHEQGQLSKSEFRRRLSAARDAVLRQGLSAGHEGGGVFGGTVAQAWGRVLSIYHDAGRRSHEQRGRTSHSVRGDRPPDHARDAERHGAALERTDLDGDCDLSATGSLGVRVLGGGGWGVVRWHRATIPVAGSLSEQRAGGVLGCKVC